jgi:Helicase HerA, central domain/TraM recognition site of TraD and TraG
LGLNTVIGEEDVISHSLFIGSTGAGKTNALLYWLRRLFSDRGDLALVLIDPHGDAAVDLVRVIPKSMRERITILDPSYVSFGLNPLSLPAGAEGANKVQILQTQVEELSALLSDVFNTDATTAPRLMWIFKGALYYLYTLHDNPTFRDLYRILVDFISLPKSSIESMLMSGELKDEIIRSTIDAISKLQKDAFAPVVNRISNFVLPPQSITPRTFCSRASKLDFDEMTTPGRLTIFRLTKSLPYDFRRLIAASIVMRFYFAVEKRAARLERAGEPASARTPIILAMDEFQNISDLKLLDTILSESRKYGLYLWIVNQNIQQIREQLYSAISGNIGPIFCFRVGPDDASKMAELISPRSKEDVRDALISLPDYTCVVRKRPHGDDVAAKPLLLAPFPKLSEPLCDGLEVVEYMKGEMEERYGGAQEAMDLVYKSAWQQIVGPGRGTAEDKSKVRFSPVHWRILTTGYLKLTSDEYSLEFSRLRSDLFAKCSWLTSTVHTAANDLVNAGYLTQTFEYQPYVMKGKDVYGNAIWVPPDPSVRDDVERSKTVIYHLTPDALDWFQTRPGPSKAGDPKHIRVIEKLLKEQFWTMGYFCVVDWGEKGHERPDIGVLRPKIIEVEDKRGNKSRVPDPYNWDYSTAIAVEVEMSPQKSREQLLQNYSKNKRVYAQIRFVATSENHAQQIREILGEEWVMRDPEKLQVKVVDFEDLNEVEPGETEEVEGSQQGQAKQTLGRAEEIVLSLVIAGGYTSREELAKKCSDAGRRGREVGLEVSQESDREGALEKGGKRLRADRGVKEAVQAGYSVSALSCGSSATLCPY